MRRGEVWWVNLPDLPGHAGGLKAVRRPVLVLQCDAAALHFTRYPLGGSSTLGCRGAWLVSLLGMAPQVRVSLDVAGLKRTATTSWCRKRTCPTTGC